MEHAITTHNTTEGSPLGFTVHCIAAELLFSCCGVN